MKNYHLVFFRIIGVLLIAAGILGAVLPLVPGIVFIPLGLYFLGVKGGWRDWVPWMKDESVKRKA